MINYSTDVIMKDLSDIKPYANNPKDHSDNVHLIANSIKAFGFKQPILVDSDLTIIAGHGRYLAARDVLKLDQIPVIIADDLSPAQIKALRLADNQVAQGKMKQKQLDQELAELLMTDIDMTEFGFDPAQDLDPIEEVTPEKQFTQELNEENNFVVLFFDNSIDWLQAQTVLGMHPVKALHSKPGFEAIGLGRVADGSKLVNELIERGIELDTDLVYDRGDEDA